jgi:hypothetical protein
MTTIRTRLAALEARLGGDEQARMQRQINAMSDAELDAAIAAYDAADAHLSDEELAADWRADGFSEDDIALIIASRARHHENGGQS